ARDEIRSAGAADVVDGDEGREHRWLAMEAEVGDAHRELVRRAVGERREQLGGERLVVVDLRLEVAPEEERRRAPREHVEARRVERVADRETVARVELE